MSFKFDSHYWSQIGRKSLKIASEAASVAIQLRTDSGPLGWISIGAKVANTILENQSNNPMKNWSYVKGISPLGEFTCRTLESLGLFSSVRKNASRVLSCKIEDITFTWIEYDHWIDGPYCEPEKDPKVAAQTLRKFLWDILGNCLEFRQPDQKYPILETDPINETLSSKTAQELWDRQKPFLEANRKRAVLLVGEPGTGKSNIVRFVAFQAGGYSLRLQAMELNSMSSLSSLCEFMTPDAIIIDDLDRIEKPGSILGVMDQLLSNVKLLLVTVNDLKKLDPAIIRRFDDIQIITSLDEEVLNHLLEGIPESDQNKLRTLPIRYIKAYRDAVEVLGIDQASKEIDDLVNRRNLVLEMMKKPQENSSENEEKLCLTKN